MEIRIIKAWNETITTVLPNNMIIAGFSSSHDDTSPANISRGTTHMSTTEVGKCCIFERKNEPENLH